MLHCFVQSMASGWSELSSGTARIQELDETNRFQQSFCGTVSLTSIGQKHFCNYCCSLWVSGGSCRKVWIILVNLQIWRPSYLYLWSHSWIIFSLEAAFPKKSGSQQEAELCMDDFLSLRNFACWNGIFRLAESSKGWLVKKKKCLSTLGDQQHLIFHFAKQSCIDSILIYKLSLK